jgi:hypothetical protein
MLAELRVRRRCVDGRDIMRAVLAAPSQGFAAW